MTRLRRTDGKVFQLRTHTVVGRAPCAQLTLSSRSVSFEHAAIHHLDGTWHVRDLASKNGTFVNGKRIDDGKRMTLKPGDVVAFGDSCEEWRMESYDRRLPSDPVELVETNELGRRAKLSEVKLRFCVSPRSGDVDLTLEINGRRLSAGNHVYYRPLLLLAQARLDDRKSGLPEAEEGWRSRSDLLEALEVCNERLNLDIHRVRRMLLQRGIVDAVKIVQRRRQSMTIRLGTGLVSIAK